MDKSFVVPRRLRARDEGGSRIEVAVIEDAVLIVDAALHDGLDLGLAQDVRGQDGRDRIGDNLYGLTPSPDGKCVRACGDDVGDAADPILTTGLCSPEGGGR